MQLAKEGLELGEGQSSETFVHISGQLAEGSTYEANCSFIFTALSPCLILTY